MPRASWRGFLGLSLVSCPIYLSPATSRTNQFACIRCGDGRRWKSRKTAHRIEVEKSSSMSARPCIMAPAKTRIGPRARHASHFEEHRQPDAEPRPINRRRSGAPKCGYRRRGGDDRRA